MAAPHEGDPNNEAFSSAREPGRGYHDIGGLAAGEVDISSTETRPWERLSVALANILGPSGSRVVRVDEVRRKREEIGVELYNELGYFERGTESLCRVLIEKGVINFDELEARMKAIAERIAQEGR